MKAAIFEKLGLENLKINHDVELPKITDHDVLIRVKMAGVNPIDNTTVSGTREIKPLPHIPGAETSGVVEECGRHVKSLKKGDRVIVYNIIFDGMCDMCMNGNEMLCRNGGLLSLVANGGFAEYISVPEKSAFKIPDEMQWQLAASIPVTTLTPYHALKQAALKIDEFLVIFGASGNTGMMATQFGKKMGAKVIAVSKQNWIKEFGADYIITEYDKVAEKVKDLTRGKMAEVVLNSLGVQTWENSFASVGLNGRWVTFGGLTGADVKLNVQSLYSKQIKLIGCNGGTRKEMTEVIDISKELKTRVWKIFTLDDAKEALEALFSKERDGRILLKVS
ncbi:MAG TPA: alcohol dehydrogenase catalytic domain-containing protein [Bacteroidia bacterium]|nr:alcohol dehydrogenase catalytic domain-containing protein [Bacteroidia bacterium]